MPEKLEAELVLGYREFTAGVDQAVKASQKLEDGVGNAMDLVEARAKAAMGELAKQVKIASAEFGDFAKKATEQANKLDLKELESRFNGMAKAGADAFASVLESGGNFQEGLLRINTIAGLSESQLEGLGEQLKNVGKEIGVSASPTATLASYYDVLSSGFTKSADASAVLAASLKLATGGQAEASDTTRALTGVLNAYGDSSEKAQLRADQFFQTVNLGVTTVPELSKSLGLVTSTASSAGVSFEELSAAIATATLKGQTTSSAIEGIRGTIASLITPTSGAAKELARLGIVVNATTLQQKGLLGTLQEINTATGGNVDSINKIIEGQVGLATALSLSKDGGVAFAANLEQISYASGATQKALNEVNKGVNEASRTFESSVERLKISAAQAALPLQNTLIKAMTKLVDLAEAAPQPLKTAALALFGFGTAAAFAAGGMATLGLVGPIVVGQFTALGSRVIPLATAAWALLNREVTLGSVLTGGASLAMTALRTAAALATGVLSGLGRAFVVLGGGATLVLGLGVGVIALASAFANATDELIAHNHELEKANRGLKEFQDAEGKTRKVNFIGREDAIKSKATDLASRGVTADDLTQTILDTRKRAEESDNAQVKKFFAEQSDILEQRRRELIAELEKRGKENPAPGATSPAAAGLDPKEAEKQRKIEERERKRAFDEQFKNDLQLVEHSNQSHELKIKQYQDLSKVYEQDGNKKREIEDKVAEEQKKIAADRKKSLQEKAKQDIQDAEVKDDGQRLKNLQELAKKYKDNGDIRRSIEDKIAVVEDRIQKKREQDIKKTRDLKKDAADEEIKDAENNISKLEHLKERGTDTTAEQKTQLRKSADAAKKKVDLEVEDKSEGADKATAKIAKDTGNREKIRIEEQYQDQVKILDENATQDRIQRATDLNATEVDLANQRIDLYKQMAEAGGASESQVRSEIEERYKLQLKSIDLQEQLVKSQTDDAEKISQAERAAAIAKVQAENDKQRAIEETTESLKKQKKESASGATSLNLGGSPYGLDQFFKRQDGFLDLTAGGGKKGNAKELARQRKVLDAMNGSKSPKDVKSAVDSANAAAAAGETTKRIAMAIDLYQDGKKIPSKVRKATVDGKGAEVEEAGRNL